MSKVGDLAIKVGEYEKDGETKGRYVNAGALMEGDNGLFLLLDPTVNLAGALVKQRMLNPQKAGDSVLCSVFTRQEKAQPAQPKEEFSDDIPF